MKRIAISAILAGLSSFGICKEQRIPTCEEAAKAFMEQIERTGIGDCMYSYTNAKPLSVDKKEGAITCQAIASRNCPDMPEENFKKKEKYTARYGIVVDFIH